MKMTYCEKCGTKNEDTARFCRRCGNALAAAEQGEVGQPGGRPAEGQCFGLPQGREILGVTLGTVIILIGLTWFLGINFWNELWYLFIIIVGVLIVAGAIYRGRRRQ